MSNEYDTQIMSGLEETGPDDFVYDETIKYLRPTATAGQTGKVFVTGETMQRRKKQADYPENLIKALKLDLKTPTADQIRGLEFALRQLKESYQEIIWLYYRQGLTYKQISERVGKSRSRCGQICKYALRILRSPSRVFWITEGYDEITDRINKLVEAAKKQFIAEGKLQEAALMDQSPENLPGITPNIAMHLMNAGIMNIGTLREALKRDFWTYSILGIGDESGKKIVCAMFRAGLIDQDFEAYKEVSSKEYCQAKYARMRNTGNAE